MLTLRRAEGCEFDPRPGQYSRMSLSSDPGDWHGFPSSEYAFLSKFYIYLEHCARGEALIISHQRFSSNEVASHVKQRPLLLLLL